MMSIKELKAKEDKAHVKYCKLRNRRENLEEKRLMPQYKKYEGRCFAYQNSYGCDSKPWTLYQRVDKVDRVSLDGFFCHAFGFQTDCQGKVSVELNRCMHSACLGKQIATRQFDRAWAALLRRIKRRKEA